MSNLDESSPPDDTPRDPGEGRYCIECYYPLKGLDSPGRCPECGRSFDFSDFNTFTYESHAPTVVQRAFSTRSVALFFVVVLETAAVLAHRSDLTCAMVPMFPFWMFVLVWLCCVVLGIDRSADDPVTFIVAGSIIGGLSFLAFGLSPVIFFGIVAGGVCGLYMAHLKDVGWFD